MLFSAAAHLAALRYRAAALQQRLDHLGQQRAGFGLHTPAYIALDYKQAEEELAECTAAIAQAEARTPGGQPPYIGLRPFSAANAAVFFGRDVSTLALLNALERLPLLTVVGASGVGKSSLVHAGLLPKLAEDAHHPWRCVAITPGARPLDALAEGFARLGPQPLDAADEYRRHFASDPHSLARLARLTSATGERWLVLIDQAEEVWARAPADPHDCAIWADQQQRPLLDLLATTIAEQAPDAPQIVIMLVLRSDFLHHLVDHPRLGLSVQASLMPVRALAGEDLLDAIVQPAQLASCYFQPGLVNALLAELRDAPGALPLLQHTLLALWQRRNAEGELTWAAFEQIGRVAGALASTAGDTLARHFAGPELREQARQLLLRLVQPGHGTPDIRRRVQLADLATPTLNASAVRRLLGPLERARLVIVGPSPSAADPLVELAHDALIHAWPILQQWLEASRADLRQLLELEEAAREWDNNQRDCGFLWQGRRLAQIDAWQARTSFQINQRAHDFAAACRLHARNIGQGLPAQAHGQASATEAFSHAVRLAELAASQARSAPDLALLLAGEALALHENAITHQTARDLLARHQRGEQVQHWASGQILRVAFGPAGETLAAVADGNRLVLHTIGGPARQPARVLYGHIQPVLDVAFSPGAQLIATASLDKTLRLWPHGEEPAAVLRGHGSMVVSALFSPDGERLVSTSADKTARLWQVSGAPIAVLRGHTDSVLKGLFSPDGMRVLTLSTDKTARLWEASGKLIAELRRPGARLLDAAFSPDSQLIATAASDASIQIWNARGAAQATLHGHTEVVARICFVGDASTLLSASADGTARLWSAHGAARAVLAGHGNAITCIAASPNGEQLATGAFDSSVRIWDRTGYDRAVLRGHSNGITSVQFTPNGQQLVSTAFDRTVRHSLATAEALLAEIGSCVQRRLSEQERVKFGIPRPAQFCAEPERLRT